MMEMNENFILELSTSLEEQVTSYQHTCSQIFSRNEFVDCTLCCSDGQLQAHRVILASVSNYMHTMLSTTPWPTPCSHPMLFFKSFSTSDMKSALEFIYTGKSKVSKNKLPTLMNIARELGCGSLSKAIEKAIHTCGVEIFRKRIQLQTPQLISQPVSTSTTYAYSTAASFQHQNKTFIPDQSQSTARTNNRSSQQKPKDDITDHYLLTQSSPDKNQQNDDDDDEAFCVRNDIKLEPEENMMLELDPSSIVTTMDSASNNISKQVSSFSDASNDFLTTHEDVKADNTSCSTEMEGNYKSRQVQEDFDDIIVIKNKLTGREIDEIPNVDTIDNNVVQEELDDDGQVHDEEDEEMPITVVDLKSLAETGPESEADAIIMSSAGIENSDTLPANCLWCFQIFTSLTLLQRHIKTHVGKYKPYSCQYCPASFARTAHLKRHIRTHTGEKPFVCTFCSRAFSRQDKLKTHLEKHLLDQHLQNASTLTPSTGFSTFNQTNTSLGRLNNAIKASSSIASTSTTVSGLSPQKQTTHGISNSTSFNQCLPSSAYQYFINEGPETWPTQTDRISKGLLAAPGQITISTTISPSTTITPVSSLLAQTNPPHPHL